MANRSSYTTGVDPVAASSLNILAGAWLILSPFLFRFWDLAAPTWNNIAVGVAVVSFAAIRAAAPLQNVELSWFNCLLGVWMIISPWALGYSDHSRMVWNNVVLGILVGVLAMWSALTAVAPRTPYARR